MLPHRHSNAAGEWNLRTFSVFPPTKRREGWLTASEETAFAQADGKGFSAISLMFPSTDAREILTEKARSREILAYSQKHDDQETRTVAVFIS